MNSKRRQNYLFSIVFLCLMAGIIIVMVGLFGETNIANSGGKIVPLPMGEKPSEPLPENGCWAQIFDGYNFKSPGIRIIGAVYSSNMEMPDGVDWTGRLDSLVVGPKATLYLYSEKEFKGEENKLTAFTKISNYKDPQGDNTSSFKLICNS